MQSFSESTLTEPRVRVCILMNRFHIGGNVLMNGIIDNPDMDIVGIVQANLWDMPKLGVRNGFFGRWLRWTQTVGVFFQLALIAVTLIHFGFILLSRVSTLFLSKHPKALRSTHELAREHGIPIVQTRNINSPETIKVLQSFHPDIIVSNNFQQIIRTEVLSIPAMGCVNMHPGLLPAYRGMMPFFWKMLHRKRQGGITLHFMDEGIDTGDIIVQKHFSIRSKDSLYGIWRKTAEAGAEAVREFMHTLRWKGIAEIHRLSQQKMKNQVGYFSSPTKETAQIFWKRGNVVWKWPDVWAAWNMAFRKV